MMYSRKCIVSGQICPVEQLIRFALFKDGTIKVEKATKLGGRGAYCKNEPEIIEQLFKRKLLNRAFKRNINPNIYEALKQEVASNGKTQKT